jgi:hypothetical protein
MLRQLRSLPLPSPPLLLRPPLLRARPQKTLPLRPRLLLRLSLAPLLLLWLLGLPWQKPTLQILISALVFPCLVLTAGGKVL